MRPCHATVSAARIDVVVTVVLVVAAVRHAWRAVRGPGPGLPASIPGRGGTLHILRTRHNSPLAFALGPG